MTPVRLSRTLPIPAERAWDLVTDLRNHPRWIPLTWVDAPNNPVVGSVVSARTGPRGLGIVDRMVIERSDPPSTDQGRSGSAAYRKLGPVLLGTAELQVHPTAPDRCRVTWIEQVHLRGTPTWLSGPPVWPFMAGMVALALARLRAEVTPNRAGRRRRA